MTVYISSRHNARIKEIVRLHTPKGRNESGLCSVEGVRACGTALEYADPEYLFVTEECADQYRDRWEDRLYILSPSVMAVASQATTPSGVIGIFSIPKVTCVTHGMRSGIILCDIADPGNMGTIMRTAAAVSVDAVIVIDGCDPWGHKAMQASAGAAFSIPIISIDFSQYSVMQWHAPRYALTVLGGSSILGPSYSGEGWYLLGNEAHGLSDQYVKSADACISLPMPGGTESLNAAVAGSIALYLAYLQRTGQLI